MLRSLVGSEMCIRDRSTGSWSLNDMKGGRGRGRTDVRSMLRAANSIRGRGGGKGFVKATPKPVDPEDPRVLQEAPRSHQEPASQSTQEVQPVVVPSIPRAVAPTEPPKMATFTAPVRKQTPSELAASAQAAAAKAAAVVRAAARRQELSRRPNKLARVAITPEEMAEMPLGDLIRHAVTGPGMRQSCSKSELADLRRASRTPVYGYQNTPESEAEREKALAQRTLAPQVRIVDGQMVIEEQSTVHIANNFTGVRTIDSGSGRAISSWSYSGNQTSARWGQDETDRFFQALGQCGTDFTLMESFFPKPDRRTRRQLHAKFKREERLHPHLIELALKQNVPLDHQALDGFDPAAALAAQAEGEAAEACLLYTSDAADEEDSVDLGGRRIIKKKKETFAGSGRITVTKVE
eukprot:TRINITY_DN49821_c0_g1_i3.p1 TRINITY_DN49821_c0_g1~~TRINITY_DN49821_c0_g1_i3.p1  ORF type:complete len:408 (-),score=93.36 TRINITY_DN49821_c0_g1_i3:41-1264(-)